MFCWKKNKDKENAMVKQCSKHLSENTSPNTLHSQMKNKLNFSPTSLNGKSQGVDIFMDTVMGIDNQDLVSKMECFTVQGMKGSAKTTRSVSPINAHKSMHDIINQKLLTLAQKCNERITSATLYSGTRFLWKDGQIKFCLQILSQVSRWDDSMTYWKSLSDEKFEKLRLEHEEKLKSGVIIDRRHHT
ncbi:hypothetical protein P692DRAFT_20819969 [Suillus brevipes Sb2]|nr:hypothetical protein P692DRAFT_20819969 [Suillus brevipes Sb2]